MLRSASTVGSSIVATALLLAAALGTSPAAAQTIFDQVHTIAAPTTGVPQEFPSSTTYFTVPAAGTYTVTLADLGALLPTPAPLASVKLAVTGADALVGAPLVGPGTLTLTLAPSVNYRIHVAGMPGSVLGSGPFGITVNDASMTQLQAFQGALALPPSALPNSEGALDGSFTVGTTASYTVTLSDLQLPQSLTTLTLLLIAQGGASPVLILPSAGQQAVMLTAGTTYDIFAVGQANASAGAGLYSAIVSVGSGGGGTVVFARAVPVGSTLHLGSPVLTAGNYTLSAADLAFPTALAQFGAALLFNGVSQAQLAATGSSNFTAAAGTYEAYAAATAASAAPGAGSYAVQVAPQGGGAPALALARGVTAAGSALSAYSFDTTVPAAGAETVSLTDFQFPAALASVRLAAAQVGALLGTPISTAGSFNITAASGPVSLVAFAQAGSGTAGGLFGLEVAPPAGGTPVLDVTQAVGAIFTTQKITVTAAGNYSVTATDLAFPATFASYDTIVTQGTSAVGSIYGGGTFDFMASPGDYYLNVIAQPAGSDQAGTYALTVASAPPAPTVSLSVDRPQVASGSSVDLVWSSANTTSCTASGGWSGSEPTSGTATSAALTESTTFTLACAGSGGTTSRSVTVTVTQGGSGGGGGGALDPALLAALATLLGAAVRRRYTSLPRR